MCGHREKTPPCQQLDLGLQSHEKINFCDLGHSFCGILLQQPQQTHQPRSMPRRIVKQKKKAGQLKSLTYTHPSLSSQLKLNLRQWRERQAFKTWGVAAIYSRRRLGYAAGCNPLGEPQWWPGLHTLDDTGWMTGSRKKLQCAVLSLHNLSA